VKTSLITTRRIVFTPNVDVKDELKNTSIQITCLDEDGNVLKRVTSSDSGEVEDPENGGSNENQNQNENGGGENQGGENQGGENTGGGENQGGDNTGGDDNGGGDNGGNVGEN